MPFNEQEIICLVGTGRNGSSLLARLLDGTPGTYVHIPEMTYVSAFNDLAARGEVGPAVRQNATRAPLDHLATPVDSRRLADFYVPQTERNADDAIFSLLDPPEKRARPFPRETILCRESWTVDAFLPANLAASAAWLCPDRSFERIVFRTIETPYIAEYERLFPRMRFIHLIRHPYQVWLSNRSALAHKRQPPWYIGGDNLLSVVDIRWGEHARFLCRRPDPARHFVLTYERLAAEPERALGDLCGWLGAPVPAGAPTQTVLDGHPIARAPASRRIGIDPVGDVYDVHTRAPHLAATELNRQECTAINLLVEKQMAALNYEAAPMTQSRAEQSWVLLQPFMDERRDLSRAPRALVRRLTFYVRRRAQFFRRFFGSDST